MFGESGQGGGAAGFLGDLLKGAGSFFGAREAAREADKIRQTNQAAQVLQNQQEERLLRLKNIGNQDTYKYIALAVVGAMGLVFILRKAG